MRNFTSVRALENNILYNEHLTSTGGNVYDSNSREQRKSDGRHNNNGQYNPNQREYRKDNGTYQSNRNYNSSQEQMSSNTNNQNKNNSRNNFRYNYELRDQRNFERRNDPPQTNDTRNSNRRNYSQNNGNNFSRGLAAVDIDQSAIQNEEMSVPEIIETFAEVYEDGERNESQSENEKHGRD